MEKELECPICLDIYGISKSHIRAPKILNCGHSICKECLEAIINRAKDDFFSCPMCNEKINKKQNVDDYTTVQNIIGIVNSVFNIKTKEIEEEKPIKYNIISLGNTGVGKTSIFQRLSKDIFSESLLSTSSSGEKYHIFY